MRNNIQWRRASFVHIPFKEVIEMDSFKKLLWTEKFQFVEWYKKNSTVKMDPKDQYLLDSLTDEFQDLSDIADWRINYMKEIGEIQTKEEKLNYIKETLAGLYYKDFNSDLIEDEDILPRNKIPFLENLLKVTEFSTNDSYDVSLNIEINTNISTTLTLIKELGIWDFLKTQIKANNGTDKDLEKLIAYLFRHHNPDSVGRYFPYMENTTTKNKHSPYTEPAIKRMKQILKECKIEVKGNYTKKVPKNTD
ncbi:MAG: hypothetical protein WAS55_08475 [Saprospiraceae bacterium]